MKEMYNLIEAKAFRALQLCCEGQEEWETFLKQYDKMTNEVSAAEDARNAAESSAGATPNEGEVEKTPSC